VTDIRERGHPIRFGIVTPQMWRSWEEIAGLWSRAEGAGWDAAFVVDHYMSDWEGEMGGQLEAFTLLSGLAREVPRIDLGVYVASVTHKPADYQGSQVRLVAAPFEPKPLNGRMRILIGSRRRRMLGLLARHGDLWDSAGSAEKVIANGTTLDEACAGIGRDPDEIVWMHEEIARGEHATVDGLRARVGTLAPIGVSFFLVNVWPRSDPGVIEALGAALPELRREWV
jgi:alkanesulfonate monooxygenase SsuD/methylene tetrahydromethanopterin reductase-like flavin-dependent oxidoreductase (luciferase family)